MKRLKAFSIWILIGLTSLWIAACTKPSVESPVAPLQTIEPCHIPPVPVISTNADLLQYTLVVLGELKKCAEKVSFFVSLP